MKHLLAGLLILLSFSNGFANLEPLLRQDEISFRNVNVESRFPEGITFRIEICGRPTPSSVIFNYTTSADATSYWGWTEEVWSEDEGQTLDNCDMRKFHLETKELEIPPFAPVKYYWSLEEGGTTLGRSPEYVYLYKDENFAWKSIEDERVSVWWHDRSDTFGQDVMAIASQAFDDQAAFYSLSLESPITIVIANTSEEFFAWQSEENYAGGMAFPDISLTVQFVEGEFGYYNWLNDVIPHEISHIYFYHLVKRYSGASYWLNEGLATYNEYSDHSNEWSALKLAYDENQTISLQDLEYGFGENTDKIDLAYAESYYAVLYMEEFYGKESISALLSEYKEGTSAEAAFEDSFGKNPEEFEDDFMTWLEDRLKTPPPNTERSGPESSSKKAVNLVLLLLSCLGILMALGMGAVLVLAWVFTRNPSKKFEPDPPIINLTKEL